MDQDESGVFVARVAKDIFKIENVALAKAEIVTNADGGVKVHGEFELAGLIDHHAENVVLEEAIFIGRGSATGMVFRIDGFGFFARRIGEVQSAEVGGFEFHGYAAALLSRIAEQVYAVERHRSLAEAARDRWRKLGYGNINLRVGDGTRGWPEAAPFDAILVSAASPAVPHALMTQLVCGGRLVIPVDESAGGQTLLKITRRSETDYVREGLEPVSFVPLVSEQGWPEDPPTFGAGGDIQGLMA